MALLRVQLGDNLGKDCPISEALDCLHLMETPPSERVDLCVKRKRELCRAKQKVEGSVTRDTVPRLSGSPPSSRVSSSNFRVSVFEFPATKQLSCLRRANMCRL